MGFERRRLLACAAALASSLAPAARTDAQAPEKLDVLIKGGTLIDPSRGVQARADLGLRGGRVAQIDAAIDGSRAARVIDAAGLLVTPGLVDLHTNVYARDAVKSAPLDSLSIASGVTTWVSAGDAGIDDFAGMRRFAGQHKLCRIHAFIHFTPRTAAAPPIGAGKGSGARDEQLARLLSEHREIVLGLHVHATEAADANGTSLLGHAIRVLEHAQTRGRILCHVGGSNRDIDAVLGMLRPGDILTQIYRGRENGLLREGRVIDAALSARKRGVILDVGHGRFNFDRRVAEAAIGQGFVPDVISSGMNASSSPLLSSPRLTDVMSTFMDLGFPLDQALAMTTINPARLIGREPHLGSMALGAPADITLMRLQERPALPADDHGMSGRSGQWLQPVMTIRRGVPLVGSPSSAG